MLTGNDYKLSIFRVKFYQHNEGAKGKLLTASLAATASTTSPPPVSKPTSGWSSSPAHFTVVTTNAILKHVLKTGKEIPSRW